MLAGLMRPTGGRAEVFGHDVVVDREHAQRCDRLPARRLRRPTPTSPAPQFLRYLANLRGGVERAVVESIAKRLDLDLDGRIGALSHGNRQKVGIVQAFMHDPRLLILDEPTSGLDPLVQREFLQLVREARDRGRTVFLSSHVLSEVEAVADVVALVRKGRVVVTDTVANLEHQAVRRLDLVFAGIATRGCAGPGARRPRPPGDRTHDPPRPRRIDRRADQGGSAVRRGERDHP